VVEKGALTGLSPLFSQHRANISFVLARVFFSYQRAEDFCRYRALVERIGGWLLPSENHANRCFLNLSPSYLLGFGSYS
jgi:hypothetical protein